MKAAFYWRDFAHFYKSVDKRTKERLGNDFDLGDSEDFFYEFFCFSESINPHYHFNPAGVMIHEIKKINNEAEYKSIIEKYKLIVKNRDVGRFKEINTAPAQIAPTRKRVIKEKQDPIPADPGLYFLFDSDRELIYIGKSKSLVDRVYLSYIEREAKYIKIMITKNEADANILEAYCIALYSPPKNRQLKSGDKPTFTLELPNLSDFIEPRCME